MGSRYEHAGTGSIGDLRMAGAVTCTSSMVGSCAFCRVDDAGSGEFGSFVSRHDLVKGDVFASEGEPCHHLVSVAEGVIATSKGLADGRRQVTGFRFAGDLVIARTAAARWPVTAQAVTAAAVCAIRYDQLALLRAGCARLDRHLSTLAAAEVTASQAHMLTLGRKAPAERLASFLLELPRRPDAHSQPGCRVELPMTRADIADYLGIETETVSRLFTRFKKHGWIDLPRPSQAMLRDLARLEALADGRTSSARVAQSDPTTSKLASLEVP